MDPFNIALALRFRLVTSSWQDSGHMTRVHFIGGEKGGVGKSVVSRVLSQYFIDHKIPFLGFDTDRSHGSLLRFYADFASPVVIEGTRASTLSSKRRWRTRNAA